MIFYPLDSKADILADEIRKIGCMPESYPIFKKKGQIIPIKISEIKPSIANILKQEMLSCKGDAAVHAETASCLVVSTDVLLLGTESVYESLIQKIRGQGYSTLIAISDAVEKIMLQLNRKPNTINTVHGKRLDFNRPILMGILNLTKDSFFDGGKYYNQDAAIRKAEEMVREGADILDIGGESTRPGALPVSQDEEMERVIPVIEKISKALPIVISVDTYKSSVASSAVDAGADIINDISGFRFDPDMARTVCDKKAMCVIMHIQGTPGDMQKNPVYSDVIRELIVFFDERVEYALKSGISMENLIIDPGFGFGKNLSHNIEILKKMSAFRKYGVPVLAGISRKSMVGIVLGTDDKIVPVEDRLFGTLGANAAAYFAGAGIFRVHDVREHKDMFTLLKSAF